MNKTDQNFMMIMNPSGS